GMIVQFGGQTPLNLALPLKAAGVPIIGTSPESIDLAEDRKRFGKLLEELEIPQPPGVIATSVEEALAGANKVGYPVLVRPSYVLPSVSVGEEALATMKDYTFKLARALKVIGLMNIQFAIQRDKVFVIEVNPRASRTVPYVSKATGVPLAKLASRIMTGRKLR